MNEINQTYMTDVDGNKTGPHFVADLIQMREKNQLPDNTKIIYTGESWSQATELCSSPILLKKLHQMRDSLSSTVDLPPIQNIAEPESSIGAGIMFGVLCLLISVFAFVFSFTYDIDDMRGSGQSSIIPGYYTLGQIGSVRDHRRNVKETGTVIGVVCGLVGLVLIVVGAQKGKA